MMIMITIMMIIIIMIILIAIIIVMIETIMIMIIPVGYTRNIYPNSNLIPNLTPDPT